ncbi:MAG: GTP-binding protein [Pseudomonadota bacterium]
MTGPPLPVTVLSGCLGAGGTPRPNPAMNNCGGRRVALTVIDMSEASFDADPVRADTERDRTDETLGEVSNGRTLRHDLPDEGRHLAREERLNDVLSESSGQSEPATFDLRDGNGNSLADVSWRDTMVPVIDAVILLNDCSSHDDLRSRGVVFGKGGNPTFAHLRTGRIEISEVAILNKVAEAGPAQVEGARKIVGDPNAAARLIETERATGPAKAPLSAGLALALAISGVVDWPAHLHPFPKWQIGVAAA